MRAIVASEVASRRLKDCVRPPVRVLFVGINPGIRSAAIGHHFAGFSNRFWTLLFDSRLVPERLRPEDDGRLPEWGLGLTNLVPRATPGIDTLRREEYAAGLRALRRKVRRWQPEVVALVGVTVYRALSGLRAGAPAALGLQAKPFEGAAVFVLPNPSGRNANYSYAEMLAAFVALRRLLVARGRRRGRTLPLGVRRRR
jgi:TDG/mug DNA glycosylase family protein